MRVASRLVLLPRTSLITNSIALTPHAHVVPRSWPGLSVHFDRQAGAEIEGKTSPTADESGTGPRSGP